VFGGVRRRFFRETITVSIFVDAVQDYCGSEHCGRGLKFKIGFHLIEVTTWHSNVFLKTFTIPITRAFLANPKQLHKCSK